MRYILTLIITVLSWNLSHAAEVVPVIPIQEQCNLDDLKGKLFSFDYPNAIFHSDCFYTVEAIKHKKADKKYRFNSDSNDETPRHEFENRIFEYQGLFPIKEDKPTRGAFMLLKRDDGEQIALYINPFREDKLHKPKHVSFSDLFIKSDTIGHTANYAFLYHTYLTPLNIINHSRLQSYISELSNPYVIDENFGVFDAKIKDYHFESIHFNNEWVVNFLVNGNTQNFNLISLANELSNKRSQIQRHETILADNGRYDIRIDQLRELIGKPLWYLKGLNRNHLFYRHADNLYPADNDWNPGITLRNDFAPDTIFWMNAYPIDSNTSGHRRIVSSNLLNQWSYDGVACVIEDIVLLPNYYGFIGTKKRQDSSDYTRARKTGEFQHSYLGDNEFAWYLVLKQDSTKIYHTYDKKSYNPNVRAVLLVDDILSGNSFISEEEFLYAYNHNRAIEQAEIEEQIQRGQAREYAAITAYGKDTARLICSGQVRFGFSTDMCTMAFTDQPYKESYEETPFGEALCYNFFTKDIKMFFINDSLIGIQFKGGRIRYQN